MEFDRRRDSKRFDLQGRHTNPFDLHKWTLSVTQSTLTYNGCHSNWLVLQKLAEGANRNATLCRACPISTHLNRPPARREPGAANAHQPGRPAADGGPDASEVAAGPVGRRARRLPETAVSLAEFQAAVNGTPVWPGQAATASTAKEIISARCSLGGIRLS